MKYKGRDHIQVMVGRYKGRLGTIISVYKDDLFVEFDTTGAEWIESKNVKLISDLQSGEF